LGSASQVDWVEIRWPSGLTDHLEGLNVDRIHTLKEGTGSAVDLGMKKTLILVHSDIRPEGAALSSQTPKEHRQVLGRARKSSFSREDIVADRLKDLMSFRRGESKRSITFRAGWDSCRLCQIILLKNGTQLFDEGTGLSHFAECESAPCSLVLFFASPHLRHFESGERL
jgi:hypothetical protein